MTSYSWTGFVRAFKLRERFKATDLPQVRAEVKPTLEHLPVVFTTREDLWQVVGFKHVNGPAKWSSYAKAEYIANTHDNYEVPLDQIALEIGDQHKTVRRLYRTIAVLRQAERLKVYNRNYRTDSRLFFSHLLTGLDYPGFRRFLAISEGSLDTPDPASPKRKKELGELLGWLFGDNTKGTEPVIKSQNPDLRILNAVLLNPAAIDRLRATRSLNDAFEVSKGDERVFEEALQKAKGSLQKASAHLAAGYDPERADLLSAAKSVQEEADDIVERMAKKKPRARGANV